MTPQAVMDGMASKNRMLTQKNDEYKNLVEKRAQAERDYGINVAMKTTDLRGEGEPVTLIPTLVKGNKVVSDSKYRLDVAYGVERACLESIKDIRSQIDSYRSLLTWLREELHRA